MLHVKRKQQVQDDPYNITPHTIHEVSSAVKALEMVKETELMTPTHTATVLNENLQEMTMAELLHRVKLEMIATQTRHGEHKGQ